MTHKANFFAKVTKDTKVMDVGTVGTKSYMAPLAFYKFRSMQHTLSGQNNKKKNFNGVQNCIDELIFSKLEYFLCDGIQSLLDKY